MGPQDKIRAYYAALAAAYGPQRWWPAETRFEMIVGAFVTQNTAWKNVEKALANLRSAGALNIPGIQRIPQDKLEELVRPSGYFRQKAARLKTFIVYLEQRYAGSLDRMLAQPTLKLREELLALNGVGPETADSILLYAGGHPVFVVDAYARRILDRHGVLPYSAKYEAIRELVEQTFKDFPPARATTEFNELHALIVTVGKEHCNREAKCSGCPLERYLPQSELLNP